MLKEYIFDVWAPEDARWSKWVKPVLFACMDSHPSWWLGAVDKTDLSWTPAATDNVGLVLDLPGAIGVEAGLDLAEQGYRPVPLYNAIPMPITTPEHELFPPRAAVEVNPIVAALWYGRERLGQRPLPADAPPAFLLDWDRSGGGHKPSPGSFDNRSVSFTTDFPSANFLLAHGVHRVIVAQPWGIEPKADLAHTLLRWQEAGVTIELKRLDEPGAPVPCEVPKPSWFGWAWQRALAAVGLSRGRGGGFGDWVPEPSSSSG